MGVWKLFGSVKYFTYICSMEETKICNTCNEEKSITSFENIGYNTKDGRKFYRKKRCTKCDYKRIKENNPEKYLKSRLKDNERRKRFYEKNKDYDLNRSKQWAKDNKGKHRGIQMKYRYNLTLEEYYKMKEDQKGFCKICGTHESELSKPLHIDHCHITDKVRGLLCNRCNLGIGSFKDNIEHLQKAINYLKEI